MSKPTYNFCFDATASIQCDHLVRYAPQEDADAEEIERRRKRTQWVLERCRLNDSLISFHPPGSLVAVRSREDDPVPNNYRVQKVEISRSGFTRYLIAGRWECGHNVFPITGQPIAKMPIF